MSNPQTYHCLHFVASGFFRIKMGPNRSVLGIGWGGEGVSKKMRIILNLQPKLMNLFRRILIIVLLNGVMFHRWYTEMRIIISISDRILMSGI